IERMVILSEDNTIRGDSLRSTIRSFISDKKIRRPTLAYEGIDLTQAVEEFEYLLLDEALRRTKGNKQAAARLLGLKRTTLVAKLRRRRGPDMVARDADLATDVDTDGDLDIESGDEVTE